MGSLKAIAPLVELVQDEFVQSKVEEAAKLFYSSNTVTINLAAVAAAGLLLVLLLALLFQPSAAPVSTGYGPPEPSYHSPEPEYGAPAHGYSRSGEGYEEARSLYNTILDSSDPTVQNLELSKRLEAVGPVMSALGNAAAKLLE